MNKRIRVGGPVLAACLFPLILAPGPTLSATDRSVLPELAASYRFLVSDRQNGGILYTAGAGDLRGQRLPLSFHDSAAYWGRHVCPTADCTVIDRYDPLAFTLLPQKTPGGDLQTERVNTHNGSNIYDAATWQIAVMLGHRLNHLPLAEGQDAYGLVNAQNRLLAAGHYGDSRHPSPLQTRARSVGSVFVYNQQHIAEAARAYSFRMLPRDWLSPDPFIDTPYARFITAANLPAGNTDYRPGVISWTDWKPITGENAWAFFIGPLQAAHLHFVHGRADGYVPFREQAVANALAVLPAFAAMQAPQGGVYYAPAGTVANQGEELVDPSFVSVENTFSVYAGLRILEATLTTTLKRDDTLAPADKKVIADGLRLCRAMLHGGQLAPGRSTEGMLSFLKKYAWQDGAFVQGGLLDKPGAESRWLPSLSPKAVDVNTWGVAALEPAVIDDWFGFGASFTTWQQVKRWGGYGTDTVIRGVGFSDQDGNGLGPDERYRQGVLSGEWTAGAITMVRAMIAHYQAIDRASPQAPQASRMVDLLRQDEQAMLSAMDTLRIDNYAAAGFPGTPEQYDQLFTLSTKPYLYASKRYLIPFGWYANPIPSTCATAWMVMVANRYNPFLPGGGLR
ncbi:MAG: hypothetical protein LBD10_03830 [Desulfobulbus sp.]|jgi:hypothetical protein|uniref:hypothetical protein n=1 Tax=Desulfobulbus sp. TaxID=895 RepID=UPI00283F2AE4|nr:hypothetical protein [Desulfobulbus sp.]MDR2549319.1 hypothetical protein [Desulfobulbus sp.]